MVKMLTIVVAKMLNGKNADISSGKMLNGKNADISSGKNAKW